MSEHLRALRGRVTSEFVPDRGRVLEIGPGEVSFPRKASENIGVKVSHRGKPAILAEGQALPFGDAGFDAVFAPEVLDNVLTPTLLLQEISNLTETTYRM